MIEQIDPFKAENTDAYKRWVAEYGEPCDYTDWEEISDGVSIELRGKLADLVERMKARSEIESERTSALLDEAVVWIEALKGKTLSL